MSDAVDLKSLEARAAALVEAARRAGADAADAVVASGRSLSIQVRDGKVEENQRAEGDTLGLRVFLGARQAIVSTSDVDPKSFPALAERAVAMAKVSPEDKFAGLAPKEKLARSFPTLDLDDPSEPSVERLTDAGLAAEAAAMAVPGVAKSGGGGAGRARNGAVLVTSDGFLGSYARSSHWTWMTAIAGEGMRMVRDSKASERVHHEDLSPPDEVGRIAGERAVAGLDPRKLETGRVHVLFDKRVASSMVGHLTGALNGSSIARKTSFLRDKLGAKLFASGIRIADDPTWPRGLASRPFDGEGVGAGRTAIVEDGVVRTFVLDCATARELGRETTGHASRGASSNPSPSTTNVVLDAGQRTPEAMMKDLGRGLLVTQFIGHGANLVTGDYSRGAYGFWFENGEIAYPVAEITIAGRLLDMFAALEPANDLEFERSVNAPTVYVGEMTLGGR